MRPFMIALMLAVLSPSQAAEPDKNKIHQYYDHVFPHIVFGAMEWKTTFFFFNPTRGTEEFLLKFYADDGQPMRVPCLGGMYETVDVTLPPMGSTSFETDYRPEVPSSWGWAEMASTPYSFGPPGDVQGLAIFRQRVPGRNDVEATVPTDGPYGNTKFLVFDNANGFVMGVALANPSSWDTMKVQVHFYGQNGALFHEEEFYMGPLAHTAFALPDRFPQSANRKGTVVFESWEASVFGAAVLGLRFSPNGSFTSVHPWDESVW